MDEEREAIMDEKTKEILETYETVLNRWARDHNFSGFPYGGSRDAPDGLINSIYAMSVRYTREWGDVARVDGTVRLCVYEGIYEGYCVLNFNIKSTTDGQYSIMAINHKHTSDFSETGLRRYLDEFIGRFGVIVGKYLGE